MESALVHRNPIEQSLQYSGVGAVIVGSNYKLQYKTVVLEHFSAWNRLLEFSQAVNNSLKKAYCPGRGLKGSVHPNHKRTQIWQAVLSVDILCI